MIRARILITFLLLASAAAVAVTPAAAQASSSRYIAVAAGGPPDDTGLATRNAAAGGWAAAQWDLTGPFGIRAPAAWPLAAARGRAPGAGVIVAVLDTGVAYRT